MVQEFFEVLFRESLGSRFWNFWLRIKEQRSNFRKRLARFEASNISFSGITYCCVFCTRALISEVASTGGSWAKSPTNKISRPPNCTSLPLTCRNRESSWMNFLHPIIEISSMISSVLLPNFLCNVFYSTLKFAWIICVFIAISLIKKIINSTPIQWHCSNSRGGRNSHYNVGEVFQSLYKKWFTSAWWSM